MTETVWFWLFTGQQLCIIALYLYLSASNKNHDSRHRLNEYRLDEIERPLRYPVRCRIVDVTGEEVLSGVEGRTPDKSRQHIGKVGTAELVDAGTVKITLDDGSEIYGHECWWETLEPEADDGRGTLS